MPPNESSTLPIATFSRSRFEKALGSARAGMKEEEGLTETFFRWCAHRPDPHLVEPAKSPELAEASSV